MKLKTIVLIVRIVLFGVILTAGSLAALMAGETRGLALADLSGVSIETVAPANDNVLYASVIDGSEQSGIYRSDNSGYTWRLVGSGLSVQVNALAVQPDRNNVLYAGTEGGPLAEASNLWRSEDGGRTWRQADLGLPASPEGIVPAVTALATDPDQAQTLYVGTDGQGVYRYNHSSGYELIGDADLYNAHVKGLKVAGDGRLYALTNQGLFVTAGDTWQQLEAVPELPVTLSVSTGDPDLLYAGGFSSGVSRSEDGGQTWQAANTGLGLTPGASLRVTALAVDEQDARRVAVSTAYGLGSRLAPVGIYTSRDGGDHWEQLAEVDELVTSLAFEEGAIYAATASGLTRYDETVKSPASVDAGSEGLYLRRLLLDPTATQMAILGLTLLLAGLVLLGRIEWLLEMRDRNKERAT